MSRVRVQANNPGRPFSRREIEYLTANTARHPAPIQARLRAMVNTASGRALLRTNGMTSRPRPTPVPTPSGTTTLAGVPVDLDRIVAGLRSTERGRQALRRRGISP